MTLEVLSIDSKSALCAPWDCVWVGCSGGDVVVPPTNRLLHTIDWRMGGVLSRFILSRPKSVVFIPTMKKLWVPWLCLDVDPFEGLTQWIRGAQSSKWRRILAVAHLSELAPVIAQRLSRLPGDPSIEVVFCEK